MSPQPGDFSEEAEDSQCCSLKLLLEEGYEADGESNPEDSETRDDGKISLKYLWLDLQVRLLTSKIVTIIPLWNFVLPCNLKSALLHFYLILRIDPGICICNLKQIYFVIVNIDWIPENAREERVPAFIDILVEKINNRCQSEQHKEKKQGDVVVNGWSEKASLKMFGLYWGLNFKNLSRQRLTGRTFQAVCYKD